MRNSRLKHVPADDDDVNDEEVRVLSAHKSRPKELRDTHPFGRKKKNRVKAELDDPEISPGPKRRARHVFKADQLEDKPIKNKHILKNGKIVKNSKNKGGIIIKKRNHKSLVHRENEK